jgi:S-adenosylmethionine:tRNA ribosyltransferase-isomerase
MILQHRDLTNWQNYSEYPGKQENSKLSLAAVTSAYNFTLPTELEAAEPPEERGLARDDVRLMVSYQTGDRIIHAQFRDLANFLVPGDLVVINTSGTVNAALNVTREDGTPLELHLSTHLPADLWIVELRQPTATGTRPFCDGKAGETLNLPGEASITLLNPYHAAQHERTASTPCVRLWVAALSLPKAQKITDYLEQYGFPIHYGYVKQQWPSNYYQTVYVTEMGSAEMPSAGRAFTPELITRLVAKGIQIAPLLLHTGVSSLEAHEPPYEEYYRVPLETARVVNLAHTSKRRVIAVGTTVVRALETVTDSEGTTHPGEGWTDVVITPQRGVRAVNALLTGLHEPYASHLAMLEAIAGRAHLQHAYAEALRERYLWHEFGDLHLILP